MRASLTALAIAVLCAPAAARADVLLDDFETGPFALSSVDEQLVVETQLGLDTAHVLGGRRVIRVFTPYAGAAADCTLVLSEEDDAARLDVVGDAFMSFTYNFAEPLDLAGAGLSAFELTGLVADAPGHVFLGIQWPDGGQSSLFRPIDASGTMRFAFDEFPNGPDFGRISIVQVQVLLDESGSVQLSEARMVVPEPAGGLAAAATAAALGALARRGARSR